MAVERSAYQITPDVFAAGREKRLLIGIAHFARRKPLGALGAGIILILLAAALFGPLLAAHGPNESLKSDETGAVLQYVGPGEGHLLGTDQYGRDVLSRILLGARTTLAVALVAMAVATVGSLCIGMVSAYAGGWVDLVLQRLMDGLMAFPGLILAMMVIAFLGNSWQNLFLTIGVLLIGGYQRIVRSAVLGVRSTAYVEAAQCLGASHTRILLRHILPNILPVVIVIVSIGMGAIVIIEASLSYLGLGAPAPTPSWGRDFADGRTVIRVFWWVGFFPGLAIALVVIGFNLLGDALRDVLDPRLRRAL